MIKISPASPDGILVTISEAELDDLLEKEWLLTNQRGSYASGTVLGCNTRRYHGLLVAALEPPVKRVVTLSSLLEKVRVNGTDFELSNFEFSDRLHPQGYKLLKEFRRDCGVHFIYELPTIQVEKSLYLDHEQDMLMVRYDFQGQADQVTFTITPMVALRDFHAMQSSSASLEVEQNSDIVTAHVLDPHGPAVHFLCRQGRFQRGADWWYSMRYRQEARRGQQDYEDVWVPGSFQVELTPPGSVTLIVHATAGLERPGPIDDDVDNLIAQLQQRQEELITLAQPLDEQEKMLAQAADQFIVRRKIKETPSSTSILAGYHWFADWGRDTFVSLPGLLLSTGRFAEAREVLSTFGAVLDGGMIPNRFDDYGGPPHYNSVDASLWFINAAYQYLLATEDKTTFNEHFHPIIAQIIQAFHDGTKFNIHADEDGLIIAGDSQTQLTWMDARCNGVSFTPRYGKAVEVNALWINALRIMAQTGTDQSRQQSFRDLAEKAQQSFSRLFWNQQNGCLNDCILPDGSADMAIRPNQIFAVSLPFSCLEHHQQISVVQVVQEQLLTPYGLRSLSPLDSRYQGQYHGDQFQRDSAYHQGTVWAYLMGPFVEAYLKVNNYSSQAKEQARQFIAPLLQHLSEDGCLGSVSEIFDGDFPFRPKGCIAQAWSVAELSRVKQLLR